MGSKVNSKHGDAANMSGEKYLKGRTAGVEGTYGKAREGVAEATAVATVMDQSDSGSVQADLTESASSMYRKAVMNKGDDIGDKALTER